MTQPRIVTFGGGTGAPVIIKSLIAAGFSNISAICASMDSGGRTGFTRTDERDRVISVSDLFRNLLALIDPQSNHLANVAAFSDLISYTDGRNRNIGYNIYYALLEKYHNKYLLVQQHLERLLDIQFHGTAIPVSLQPTTLCFKTQSGNIFRGEHELDHQSMSTNTVSEIWIEPQVDATPEAISAVNQATHVIYCPGSLYGSIISNFLPHGISRALQQSSAQKILFTNLVSNRNQTHHFTPVDYLQLFRHYTGSTDPIDTIVIPDLSRVQFDIQYPEVAANYAHEHAHFLGWTSEQLSVLPDRLQIVSAPLVSVTHQLNRLRHNPDEITNVFRRLIPA